MDTIRITLSLATRSILVQIWIGFLTGSIFTSGVQNQQMFTKQPENSSVVKGSTSLLSCSIAYKKGQVQWTRDDFALGTERSLPGFPRYSMVGNNNFGEYNLRISEANLEDDALFQCQVGATDIVDGIRSKTVKLTVLLPPDPPKIENGRTAAVILDKPTNLTCRANNGKPAAKITWYKDEQLIGEGVSSKNILQKDKKRVDTIGSILIIPTKDDAGKVIECHAKNEALQKAHKTQVVLDVQYSPEITMTKNVSSKMREFTYVRLTCDGIANPNLITWKWYRNNKMIINQTNNFLDIPAVSRIYHGNTVACEGTNDVGSTKIEIKLNIEFGPRFINAPDHVAADVGDDVRLSCIAEGNPPPSIIWRKKGTFQPLGGHPTLVMEDITDANFGTYTCTATVLGFDEIKRHIFLLEKASPRIMSDGEQYSAKGETAHIECLAISVPKPNSIIWLRNGRPINYANSGRFSASEKDLPYGRKSILQILNVHSEDFGSYNCSVTNSYGRDMAMIFLLEKDVLPLPYIIGGAVGGVVVILIIILACVVYHKYKNTDSGSDSYTDSDSTMEKKKDMKSDSPTLMDQWRQDYNKEFYRYSDNFDELYSSGSKGNNNAYGFIPDPYSVDSGYREGSILPAEEYIPRPEEMAPADRYESNYNTGFVPSSFKTNRTDTHSLPRLPPADAYNSKFSTNV